MLCNARNNTERISQRKHDFDSIENFIRCKDYPKSISDRGEKPNFRRDAYRQMYFFVQYSFVSNFLSN